MQFASAEHAYQYTRATFLGKLDAAFSARTAKTPQEAKRACARVLSSKEWDSCKYRIMREVVYAKFSQNPALQPQLTATGDSPLLEASYDSYWGCGLPLTSKKMLQGEWQGKNYLGAILVECRADIMKEKAASSACQSDLNAGNDHHVSTQHATFAPQTNSRPFTQPQQVNTNYHRQGHSDSVKSPRHNNNHRPDKQRSSQVQPVPGNQNQNRNQYGSNPGIQSQGQSHSYYGTNTNYPVPAWSNPMIMQQPNYTFSNPAPPPFYMYPQMPMMPSQGYQFPPPAPVMNQPAGSAQLGSPTSSNNCQPFFSQNSPHSVASDYNQGDRRLSYDPLMSPVAHV